MTISAAHPNTEQSCHNVFGPNSAQLNQHCRVVPEVSIAESYLDADSFLPMMVSLHDTRPRAAMTVSTRSVLALWSIC